MPEEPELDAGIMTCYNALWARQQALMSEWQLYQGGSIAQGEQLSLTTPRCMGARTDNLPRADSCTT